MKGKFEGYREIEPDLLVKEASLDLLSEIDSLVLDIDGVVIDVSQSFRVAMSKTVQHYFSKVLGWPGETTLITPEETQAFKLAGGFNNDWELTYAIVLFYLGKAEKLFATYLDYLRERGQKIEDFTAKVAQEGGGLEVAGRLTLGSLNEAQRRNVVELWRKDEIKQIFQEYYAGLDHCERLYGFKPTHIKEKGLLNAERILLDKSLLAPFLPRVAVVTGRTKKEAQVALERSGLVDFISPELVLSDDGGLRKPDPGVLLDVGSRMKTGVGIYIGDTPDDLRTVKNFGGLQTEMVFLSGIVLRKAEESQIYIKENADVLSKNVNDILSVVLDKRGRR